MNLKTRSTHSKPSNLRSHLHSAVLLLSAVAVLRLASPACAQGATVTPSIANNATGVALNLPMVFTFSKAMDTDPDERHVLQLHDRPGGRDGGMECGRYSLDVHPDRQQLARPDPGPMGVLFGTDVDGTRPHRPSAS